MTDLRELAETLDAIADDTRGHSLTGEDHDHLRAAAKFLRALTAQPAPAATTVPEGWVLVPNLATREMVQAACDQLGYPGGGRHVYAKSYAAMLAAAPTPQATKENHDV